MEDGVVGKSSECVQVVVRCRPPNQKELREGRQSIVKMNTETGYVELHNPNKENGVKGFTFDAVYDENSTQRMVYDESAFPLVESVLEGFNGTIFAYGQTGCGKTWTMTGMEDPDPDGMPELERGKLRGIIPNSFEHIFNTIQLKSEETGSEGGRGGGQNEFLVRASYLEIYNEEIRDLLSSDPKKKLELKETPDKGVFVKDLMYEVVEDREQIDEVLARGTNNRTVAETLMNSVSSRSHSIFGVVIEANEVDSDGESHMRVGKLNLVDLAGSERQSKTGASGDRLKEGCKINLSLSALGNVISALVDGKGKHIPYRDSKLTRLLQDSLGGNTKTVMISAISPADYNYDETASTLRYANRAKNIKNKPVINEDPKDTLLREYKEEIENLKRLLEQHMLGGGSTPPLEEMRKAAGEGPLPALAGAGAGASPERVVEKVVEKVVPVPDKKIEAENRALQDYSDAVVEQRNRLGQELDRKEEEIEQQRRARKGLEDKLKSLQGKVLGQDKTSTEPVRREKVQQAKREREVRKAHLKLKEQKRKEAELREAKKRAEEEKRLIEEECKNAQGVAEAKQKALRALKKTMIAKMDRVRAEMRDLEQEFQEERESLLETIREQTREIKRLDQVVDIFLMPTERSKLWEQAEWDEDQAEWRLPKLRPRKGYKPLHLPGLNGEAEGGAEVVESPRNKRRGSKEKKRKKRKERSRSGSSNNNESDDDVASTPDGESAKARSSNSGGRGKTAQDELIDDMRPAAVAGSVHWPTADLPTEDGAASAAYGDRCQSRQGRRNLAGRGAALSDLPVANPPPRHLAPL